MKEVFEAIDYRLKTVQIFDGRGSNLCELGERNHSISVKPVFGFNLDKPVFHLSEMWGNNYYHWTFDILSRLLFCVDFLDVEKLTVSITPGLDKNKFVMDWLRMVGVGGFVYGTEGDPADNARCEHNLMFSGLVHPRSVELLQSFIKPTRKVFPNRFLIQRRIDGDGCHQGRNTPNRDELVEIMDLKIVYLEGMSVEDQIAMFSEADLVIGMHGAGLVNLAYCKKGCVAIELVPEGTNQAMYPQIASIAGLRFAVLTVSKTFYVNVKFVIELVKILKDTHE